MGNAVALSDEEFVSLEVARAECICLKCPHGAPDADGNPKGLCFNRPNCLNCYQPECNPANCDKNCFSGLK
jgi:hypothetical protein